MEPSYLWALAGGALIGVSASILLLFTGKVAGISGIVGGALPRGALGAEPWRPFFLFGLIGGGAVVYAVRPEAFAAGPPLSLGLVAVAGLLVGIGTRVGSGCTSGHGVCGMSRMSPRSILATMTFIAAGVATVALVRALGGWS
jgi:uncharacterized protein